MKLSACLTCGLMVFPDQETVETNHLWRYDHKALRTWHGNRGDANICNMIESLQCTPYVEHSGTEPIAVGM